jgi:hypothetical protein
VKEIRIYLEGGGGAQTKARLRIAFGQFLEPLQIVAREKRIRWQIIACGSRSDLTRSRTSASICLDSRTR